MKKEHAKALYKMGGESREIALQYFSENELAHNRPKSWGDLVSVTGWYIDSWSEIIEFSESYEGEENRNIFPTKEYAEAALALAQLLQIKKRWFDGEIDYKNAKANGITRTNEKQEIFVDQWVCCPFWTHFPTMEMAEEFINEPEIRKLLEQVKPLL